MKNMNKKIINVMLSLVLVLTLSISAYALTNANVIIDNVGVVFDTNSGIPFIDENSRTQVPLRKTMETFGCTVNWDDTARCAIVSKDDIVVKVKIGEMYITINDVKKDIDTKSVIINDRTYLPIRAVLEAFGAKVDWDDVTKTVLVQRKASVKDDIYQEVK